MNPELLTTGEIAQSLNKATSTIHKMAKRQKWPFKMVSGVARGGKEKKWVYDGLPEDVQLAVTVWRQKNSELAVSPTGDNLPAKRASIDPAILPEAQKTKGLAKADLLRLYLERVHRAGWGKKVKAREDFIKAYNTGIAYPKLFESLGKVHWKTIEGWHRRVKASGGETMALADTRGYCLRGQRSLSPEQCAILLRCALVRERPVAEAIRDARSVMADRGMENGYSEDTYRRWLKEWTETHYHVWTFIREGAKAWNDKCAYYIERDYNLINVGDILVADGHVLNFEILNPWTGKPKRMILILWMDMKSTVPLGWEIMPTENTQAISSALGRAILQLGKYPQVAYLDNGKAFRSKFFTNADFEQGGFSGLFERLGIKTIFAWPYHGQSKTVERFFEIFAELERRCPTYVGTSIEKKPPRMMRGERLHRKVYEKMMDGQCLTMEQAHWAIAGWFDEYMNRPRGGHLEGRKPIELFLEGRGSGVDPAELRYLMMSMDIRTIRRNGVKFLGQNYYDPKLYGRKHPVSIRYDLQDRSAIYVFEPGGDFICEARPVEKVHPAATALGTDEDRAALKKHIKLKKGQEKEAGALARDFLENTVLPEHRRQLESAGLQVTAGEEKPALPAPEKDITVSEAEEKRILAEVKELEALNDEMPQESPEDDYVAEAVDEAAQEWTKLSGLKEMDRMYKLLEFEVRGLLVPKEWQAFMRYYEQTPEYKRYESHFEDHRAQMAMVYQVESAVTAQ